MYNAANFNNMKNDLRFIDWLQLLDNCDKISCWERLLNTINPIISKYTPTQKPNLSKTRSIWINKDTLFELKLKKWVMPLLPQNKRLTYATCRNQSKQACRKAIAEYEKSLSREVKTNPKTLFNLCI